MIRLFRWLICIVNKICFEKIHVTTLSLCYLLKHWYSTGTTSRVNKEEEKKLAAFFEEVRRV